MIFLLIRSFKTLIYSGWNKIQALFVAPRSRNIRVRFNPGVALVPRLPRVIHILPLQGNKQKSGLPCSDKPLFCSFFDNDSYFLPRYCEKFLCHHQIFVIEFIISFKIKNLLFRREAGLSIVLKYQYGSYFLLFRKKTPPRKPYCICILNHIVKIWCKTMKLMRE